MAEVQQPRRATPPTLAQPPRGRTAALRSELLVRVHTTRVTPTPPAAHLEVRGLSRSLKHGSTLSKDRPLYPVRPPSACRWDRQDGTALLRSDELYAASETKASRLAMLRGPGQGWAV